MKQVSIRNRNMGFFYLEDARAAWYTKFDPATYVSFSSMPTWFRAALGLKQQPKMVNINQLLDKTTLNRLWNDSEGDNEAFAALMYQEAQLMLEGEGKNVLGFAATGMGSFTDAIYDHSGFLAASPDLFKALTPLPGFVKRVGKTIRCLDVDITDSLQSLCSTHYINGVNFPREQAEALFLWYLVVCCGIARKIAQNTRGFAETPIDYNEVDDVLEERPERGTAHLFIPDDTTYGYRGPLGALANSLKPSYSTLMFTGNDLVYQKASTKSMIKCTFDKHEGLVPEEGYLIALPPADDKITKIPNRQKLGIGEGVQCRDSATGYSYFSNLRFIVNPEGKAVAVHDQIKYAITGDGSVGMWYSDVKPDELLDDDYKLPEGCVSVPVTEGFRASVFACDLCMDGSGQAWYSDKWKGVDLLNPKVYKVEVPKGLTRLPRVGQVFDIDEWVIPEYLFNDCGFQTLVKRVGVKADAYGSKIKGISIQLLEIILAQRDFKAKSFGFKMSLTGDRKRRLADLWQNSQLQDIDIIAPMEVLKGSISTLNIWANSQDEPVEIYRSLTRSQKRSYDKWFDKALIKDIHVTTTAHECMVEAYEHFPQVYNIQTHPDDPEMVLISQKVTGVRGHVVLEVEIPLIKDRITRARMTASHMMTLENLGFELTNGAANKMQRERQGRFIDMISQFTEQAD
jgi:hypothetical protein